METTAAFGASQQGGGSIFPVDMLFLAGGIWSDTMELPETIRKRLEDFSRNVLFDQSWTEPFSKDNDTFLPHGTPKNADNARDELACTLALM